MDDDTTQDTFLASCRCIGTSTWSDALDALGLEGVARGLTQRSGTGRFAGYAATVRLSAGARGAYPKEEMGVGRYLDAAASGQVLMIDAGGANISTFGGLASLAACGKGLAAVVIDGGCRDIDEMRASGLWVASRHVTPLSGKTRLKIAAPGERVMIGGVGVATGDLVIGDETGVVVIPHAAIGAAAAWAAKEAALDKSMAERLRAGASFTAAGKGHYT